MVQIENWFNIKITNDESQISQNILKDLHFVENLRATIEEKYKEINEFEDYLISNYGNIKNKTTNELLNFMVIRDFHMVTLRKNKINYTKRVHNLVYETFISPLNDKRYIVRHIDGNRFNNRIDNLELILVRENDRRKESKKKEIINEIDPKNIEQGEIYKDIIGYDGRYKISNFGNVWSLLSNRKLTYYLSNGYQSIGLLKGDKKFDKNVGYYIHILVAEHFIPNDDVSKTFVDHIDNNKLNDKHNNLRWVTPAENATYYIKNFKLKSTDIVQQYDLKNKLIKEWDNVDDILTENKTYLRENLMNCISNRSKSAYGFIWKYKIHKEEYVPELKEDEVFKNIGIIDFNLEENKNNEIVKRDYILYEVSNYGTIRNTQTQKYIHQTTNLAGYKTATITDAISKKCDKIKIHRIVAMSFVEGRTAETDIVNHINEYKLDNSSQNLEWVSTQDNLIHSNGKKVNMHNIKTNEIIKTFDSISKAQEYIKCNHANNIIQCCKNKKKSFYNYKWLYA